jgi:hypothetical protein
MPSRCEPRYRVACLVNSVLRSFVAIGELTHNTTIAQHHFLSFGPNRSFSESSINMHPTDLCACESVLNEVIHGDMSVSRVPLLS